MLLPITHDDTDHPDADDPNADLKSPISLIHEIALKRSLTVEFKILSEKGPPHMKTFVTQCVVGSITTEGEGNGKKVSKKKAAETMLKELRMLPPLSPVHLDGGGSAAGSSHSNGGDRDTGAADTAMAAGPLAKVKCAKRKQPAVKKKARNLIKVEADAEDVNPISRLIQVSQSHKAKDPHYELVEEAGTPRRREFVIEVSACNQTARGVGSTKKKARRQAAESE